MFWVDMVSAYPLQRVDDLPLQRVPDVALRVHVDRTGIEQEVVVGTQAQHVALIVRAIVGTAQTSDVGTFSVRTCRCLQASSTELTGEVVQFLHPCWNKRVPDELTAGARHARSRTTRRRRGLVRSLVEELYQAEPPDPETISAYVVPVVNDLVEAVVA
jgi:hypothetical protein